MHITLRKGKALLYIYLLTSHRDIFGTHHVQFASSHNPLIKHISKTPKPASKSPSYSPALEGAPMYIRSLGCPLALKLQRLVARRANNLYNPRHGVRRVHRRRAADLVCAVDSAILEVGMEAELSLGVAANRSRGCPRSRGPDC